VENEKLTNKLVRVNRNISIRIKIMVMIVGIVIILGIWLSMQTLDIIQTTLSDQLIKQGVSLGQYISARSTDLIFINDNFSLHQLIQEIVSNNKNVRYAFILDSEGNLLTSSFGMLLPKGLDKINEVEFNSAYHVQTLNTEEGVVYDIAVPVFEGSAGTVRLGMSENEIQKLLLSTSQSLLATTILVCVFGILIAYFFTLLLTNPLTQLVEAAKAVGKGDFNKRVRLGWAHGELVQLALVFNNMVENLKQVDQLRTNLLNKIITVQEEERSRIARELHDHTGQSLTSIMIGLKMIESSKNMEDMKGKVAELRKVTDTTLEEIKDLSLTLRPGVLDDLGLEAALQSYSRECLTKLGIDVDFHSFGMEGVKLSQEVNLTIYRVVQEALTNVAKYSNASEASIIIKRNENKLIVIVEDNGIGFNVEETLNSSLENKKLGLPGMQERVNLIGGKLTIESEPGMGTTIYIHLNMEGLIQDEKNKNLSS